MHSLFNLRMWHQESICLYCKVDVPCSHIRPINFDQPFKYSPSEITLTTESLQTTLIFPKVLSVLAWRCTAYKACMFLSCQISHELSHCLRKSSSDCGTDQPPTNKQNCLLLTPIWIDTKLKCIIFIFFSP